MEIETNLNVEPFYDDFDESKKFHRILFRPRYPVQARELTQLQTILQNQIDRFGSHIFTQGSIIKGCSFFFIRDYYFTKILDLTLDGIEVDLDSYANTYAVNESNGLKAIILETVSGLQSSANGELNTLYFKYLNAGANGEINFSNSSVLTIYSRDYSIQRIDVTDSGASYTNGDLVSISGGGGSGANAYIVTDSSGEINDVILTSGGSNYTTIPTASITSNTGSGGVLTVRNYIDKVTVANSSFSTPVGKGYAFKVSDGVIFQKGHFIAVDDQSVIVSKYNTNPNNVVVGFAVNESIVNNSIDSTLNDNALGTPNYRAPGAWRLKLEPTLTVLSKDEAASNNQFFTLVEFENGLPVRQNQTAEYNEIGKELAKRTYDESGNYSVNKFRVNVESIEGNTTHLNSVISAGIAYVNGFRVQLHDVTRSSLPVASTTSRENSTSISLNFGNYVLVNELIGAFTLNSITQINLKAAAYTDITDVNIDNTTPDTGGTTIGTAYVKTVELESGVPGTPSAVYRVYLFNISMNAGYSFDQVRALQASGVAADTVLEGGIAILKEASFNTSIFKTGIRATQSYANGTQYTFRKTTTGTLSATGNSTITLAGTEEFPYGVGTLTNTQKRDFILVPSTTVRQANLSGSVSTSGNTVTGTSTTFITDFVVGDYIQVAANGPRLIVAIANNTSLSIANTLGTLSTQPYGRSLPANVPVNLERNGTSITVSGAQQITIDVGMSFHGGATTGYTIVYNGRQDDFLSTKAINKNVFVRISNTALASSTDNRWCLGLPDVHKIVSVYKSANNTAYNETTDVTSHFELINGQKDTHYGLAYLKKKDTSSLTIDGSTHLVVKLDVFTVTASQGYFTVDSYPLSNTTPVESNKINWIDVPVFVSGTGDVFDLRDCVDTRPVVSNTAVITTTLGSSTVNPANTEVFSGSVYTPSPNQTLTADINYFLPRKDIVIIDSYGRIDVIQGQPSLNPQLPAEIDGSLTIATLNIPPFPTIATTDKYLYNRSDYTVNISVKQNKRYTMREIEKLEDRIKQLEYYTSLSGLEQDTKNLVLPSEANSSFERFKHGFIVDPLVDYSLISTTNPEFKIFVDKNRAEATPTFEQGKFGLVANNYTNTLRKGNNTYLNYNDNLLIEQPIATRTRIVTQSYWRFSGNMIINPTHDNFYSTTSKPVQVDVDYTEEFDSIINAVDDAFSYIKLNESRSVDSTTFQNTSNTVVNGLNTITTVEHLTTVDTVNHRWDYLQLTPGVSTSKQTDVGSFVTNFTLSPYIRAQTIYFFATGLRPNTRHYVWFDEKSVDSYVTPMKKHDTSSWSTLPSDYYEAGVAGDILTADSDGIIVGKFEIPEGMFLVGERELRLFNVSDKASWDSSISKSVAKFNAYNFNVESANVSFNTGATYAGSSDLVTTNLVSSERRNFDRATSIQSVQTNDDWNWNNDQGGSDGDGDGGDDPLAQSFLVSADVTRGAEGANLTKVDLYFKEKDPTFGIVVEVRTVRLGIPTTEVIARKRLNSDDVNTSNTAASATTVVFDTPVFMQSGLEYAVCLVPEANSPEYVVWTGEAGGTDVVSSIVKNQDWAKGAMFLSTNASTWSPIQGEDLKLSLYFAEYSVSSGTVGFVNDAREYLTINSSSGSVSVGMPVVKLGNTYISGSFTTLTTNNIITTTNTSVSSQVAAGDTLLLIHDSGAVANLTGTVSVNATSNTVTGSGTSFDTTFTPNDFIYVNMGGAAYVQIRRVVSVTNSTSLVVSAPFASAQSAVGFHKVTPNFDIVSVVSISSPNITLNKYTKFNTNTTNIVFAEKVITGTVDEVNEAVTKVVLKDSTANSTVYLANGNILVANNNQTLTIGSVDDIRVSHFETLINNVVYPGTLLNISCSFMNSSNTLVSNNYAFGTTNYLPFDGKVRSKSNEMQYGFGAKSFNATVTLNNQGAQYLSPIVGMESTSVLRYAYNINNDTTNEHLTTGNSSVRYITKQVVLVDGQEAEDLKVYLTAYKPVGTDIKVYAKILNESDSNNFNDKNWSLLKQVTTSSVFSSTSNKNDYREFEYTFEDQPYSNTLSTFVTTQSNTIVLTSTDISSSLTAGDMIVLERPDTGVYNVRRVVSANTTAIVVSTVTTFSLSGVKIKKVSLPQTAFKNYENDTGIVRYFNSNGSAYDGYKIFAIKVVFTSNNYSLVPRMDDIRGIAVSV